jgi:hypothetical protein
VFYWNGIRNKTQSSLIELSTFAGRLKSVGLFLESGFVRAGMQASKSTLAPNNRARDSEKLIDATRQIYIAKRAKLGQLMRRVASSRAGRAGQPDDCLNG